MSAASPAAGEAPFDLRARVRQRVLDLVGSEEDRGWVATTEDPGLFGPGSVSWRVHADVVSMTVGGTAALLLQMLHPAALGGVWDHGGIAEDMTGRLKRTARFVAGTTYGRTPHAEALIARVRAIHARVTGTLPDGRAYRADDPHLLAWVHVAEATSFLAAYRRVRGVAMSGAEQDRYLAEMAEIARRLGAGDVPDSRASAERFLRDIRPELAVDDRTRTAAARLLSQPVPGSAMLGRAAIGLLPRWAARMHGLSEGAVPGALSLAGARAAGAVVRWSLKAR